jgi:hypothetical protein
MLKSKHPLGSFSEIFVHEFISHCLHPMATAFNDARLLPKDPNAKRLVVNSYVAQLKDFRPSSIAEACSFVLLGKSNFESRVPNTVELRKLCVQFIPLEQSRSDHIDYVPPPRTVPLSLDAPKLFDTDEQKQKGLDQLKSLKGLLGKIKLTADKDQEPKSPS